MARKRRPADKMVVKARSKGFIPLFELPRALEFVEETLVGATIGGAGYDYMVVNDPRPRFVPPT